RDVFKSSLAIVAVEPADSALAGDKEYIGEAVVIVIHECRAAARGLENEALRIRSAVGERMCEAGLRRHIAEFDYLLRAHEQREQDGGQGQPLHFWGDFSPSFLRNSVNSPCGCCSRSSSAFCRAASAVRPEFR